MSDEAITDEEIEENPIKALFRMVEAAGLTVTLYGQPVTEAGLTRAATATGVARAMGEELTPEKIKAIARDE